MPVQLEQRPKSSIGAARFVGPDGFVRLPDCRLFQLENAPVHEEDKPNQAKPKADAPNACRMAPLPDESGLTNILVIFVKY